MDWKHQKLNNTSETLIWEYIDGRLMWLMTKLWLKSTNWSGKKLAWISSDYFESLLLPQLLRGENDSKQSDEFQARKKPEYTILQIFLSLLPKKEQENFLRKRLKYTRLPSRYKKPTRVSASLCDLYRRTFHARAMRILTKLGLRFTALAWREMTPILNTCFPIAPGIKIDKFDKST